MDRFLSSSGTEGAGSAPCVITCSTPYEGHSTCSDLAGAALPAITSGNQDIRERTAAHVCAVGAFRLTSMARMPKSRIWTVAPDAYLRKCAIQLDRLQAEAAITLSLKLAHK